MFTDPVPTIVCSSNACIEEKISSPASSKYMTIHMRSVWSTTSS